MPKFQSTKLFDGFSTVFRQWKAEGTHCRFLHGYGISFRVWFEGELDERNWVWDFGGMKRAKGTIDGMNPKAWMDYMFDHTTIIAEDDPQLRMFHTMYKEGIIQLSGIGVLDKNNDIKNIIKYFETLCGMVAKLRQNPKLQDSWIQNDIDTVVSLLYRTKYKLVNHQ